MPPDSQAQWRRLNQLMDQALDLEPQARAGFIATACAGDAALREHMDAWLAALEASGEFMERAHDEAAPGTGRLLQAAFVPLPEGARIGAYRVERLLGRGGMGEVYAAARADGQFEQQVAIKLIHAEFAHEPALFLAERRILAGLEHPGITRLFDGGLSDDGRPYMVMERVEGRDLLSWCTEEKLGLEARLRLFIRLCEAVAYAHRRLVVHRDIKPGNVLVTAEGQPKLLDFGIAHLVGAAAAADPEARLRLTPAYAAPEQLCGGEITTATDVYALGGLLYRLLSGKPPHELGGLPAPLALERAVNETPPPPSTVAGNAPVPARRLRGDLDAIVLKALARDPQARYAGAAGLARDLQRWLDHEPVEAVRARPGYLLGRFVRRHRLLSAAAAAVLLTVLAALGVIAGYARQLRLQRDIARNEADAAQQVTDYLVSLFEAVSPARTGGKPVEPRSLVDQGRAQLEAQLKDQPLLQARLLGTVGALYCELGLSEECRRNLERALATQRGDPRANPAVTAQLLYWQGRAYSAETDYARAGLVLAEALRGLQAQQPPRKAAIAAALTALGHVQRAQQEIAPSIAALEQARSLLRDAQGADTLESAETLGSLALSYQEAGRTADAIALAGQRVALVRQRLGGSDLRTYDALDDYAEVMATAGRNAEAESARREAAAGYARIYGPLAQRTLDTESDLGNFLMYEGHLAEADEWMRKALDGYRELEGPGSRDYALALRHRGGVRYYRGDYAGAAEDFQQAQRLLQQLYGDGSIDTHVARLNLGRSLAAQGQARHAAELLQPELPPQLDGDYAGYIRFMRLKWLADNLALQQPDDSAAQAYDAAEAAFHASGQRDELELSKLAESRGVLLLRRRRYAEAAALLHRVMDDYRRAYSEDSAYTQLAAVELAQALAAQGQREEARRLAQQALPVLRRELAPQHPILAAAAAVTATPGAR
jgi:hypothetical protein